MAPLDGRAQGLLPLGEIAAAGGQQRQPPIQPDQQLVRREHLHPGRCQLDRQGQAVEAVADLREAAAVGAEARKHGLRALTEELDRRRLGQRRER
jgi:hypothetical protein